MLSVVSVSVRRPASSAALHEKRAVSTSPQTNNLYSVACIPGVVTHKPNEAPHFCQEAKRVLVPFPQSGECSRCPRIPACPPGSQLPIQRIQNSCWLRNTTPYPLHSAKLLRFFPMLVTSEAIILTSGRQGAFCCLETSAPPRPVALTHGKGENPRVPKERIVHRLQKVLKGPPDIGERHLLERKQHFPLWKRFGLGSIFTQATVFTQRSIICTSV